MRVRSRARPRQSANQGGFVTAQACFFGYFLCVKESNSAVGPTPDKSVQPGRNPATTYRVIPRVDAFNDATKGASSAQPSS